MEATFLWRYWEAEGLVLPDENKWTLIRIRRNESLTRCDWTQLADTPLTQDQRDQWSMYRQALRDLPENYATPDEVVFPTPPDGEMV